MTSGSPLPCFSLAQEGREVCQASLRMLSVRSDWFGKLWTSGDTRQSETLADCKEMFVPSETTAAVCWCFQSTGPVCHQPAVVTVHFLSMAGDLVEGGHREVAHDTTAKALGSCLLAPCPLVGKGEHWCQSVSAGHSGGSTSAAAAQRGNQGCRARLHDMVVIAES